MPNDDQAQADQLDNQTADGNAGALEAPATASENQPATTADSAPAKEGVAAMDDYMMRLQEALAPAPEGEAATDDQQAGDNPPAAEGSDAQPAEDAAQDQAATDGTPPQASEPEEDSVKRRQRVTAHDDTNALALQLYRQAANNGAPINFDTAFARAQAALGVSEVPVDSEKQSQSAEIPPAPEEIKSRIDQLKADRRKAAEDMDTIKLAELSEQIEDLQLQFLEAREIEKAREIAETDQFHAQVESSRARRDAVYPASADPNHAIHAEAERIWKAMQENGNPLLEDADAPFQVYQMAANALGIAPSSPRSAKSSPAPTPRPQAVQQSAVRRPTLQSPVASGGDRTSQPATASFLPNGQKLRSTFEYEQLLHAVM